MKKTGLFLAAAALAAALWLSRPRDYVVVTIEPGASASSAALLLKEREVIRSAYLFRALLRVGGWGRELKPGAYRFRRNELIWRVLADLRRGPEAVKISIPEGFSSWQIAERLAAAGICRADDFLQHCRRNGLEGYLFPATYYLEPGLGAARTAGRLREEFSRQIEPLYREARGRTKLNLHQVVTLASIIEREAVVAHEKSMIAAVYLNRLRLRMRLEADPTVQYVLGHWKKRLNSQDLRSDSSYNTYTRYGLPPGPICSPGVDSVKAALAPAQIKALYFVADSAGGHVFSETYEEHLKAKRSFKRRLRIMAGRR